ncbi:MAG: rod shape-determining protein MreD [Planctomycetes bacterium]|nr:rod shape-determining protein MreD [Planctomycetota bacterium]
MRWARFVVFILIATVLQADLVNVIAVSSLNIKPNLLLILLVFFAVYCDTYEAIIISFVIGFSADIIVIGSAMGPQIISYGLFGTLLAYLHRVIAIRKMPYQSAAIFVTGFLASILVCFLSFLRGQQAYPNMYVALFGTPLYSAIIGPFLFLPSAWWMHIKTHRFGLN